MFYIDFRISWAILSADLRAVSTVTSAYLLKRGARSR